MSFFVRSNGVALIPNSRAAAIAIEQLPKNVHLKVDPKQPRNEKFHRLAWAFFQLVADALRDGPAPGRWSAEDVKDDLLIATGFCKTRPMSKRERERNNVPSETIAYVSKPASISYASMDNAEFGDFMEASFSYVFNELAPWIRDSDHWSEIQTIVGHCSDPEPEQ